MTDPGARAQAHPLFGGIVRYGGAADRRSQGHERRVIFARHPVEGG
jgi:hypothetical protein